jgi:hypothetical protein
MADGVDGQHRNNPLEKAPFPGLYLQGFFPEKGDKTREGWIGPQRSAGGKAKREQDLYPNSVSKTSRKKSPTLYKRSTKGTGMLQACSGNPPPFELPLKECHR